jgi:hypothetical protein
MRSSYLLALWIVKPNQFWSSQAPPRLPLAVLELRNKETCDKMAVALDVVRQD